MMLIRFIHPDPRAGMVAQMDSSRGRQLIAAGAAIRAGDAPPPPAPDAAPIKLKRARRQRRASQ